MSAAEEKVFPSKWFLFSFLGTTALAVLFSISFFSGWIMWFFPAYIYLWSKGIQNHDRGLRKQGQDLGMQFFLYLFFTVNMHLWVGQAYLDIKLKHIHPYLSYLSLLTVPLVLMDVSLTSFGLLLLVPIIYFTGYMARGDTKLMLQYIISTIPFPILGLQTIIFTTAAYILIQETILKNEGYPMAPAPTIAFYLTYLLPLLL